MADYIDISPDELNQLPLKEKEKILYNNKICFLLEDLPYYMQNYWNHLAAKKSIKTIYGYLLDIKGFLEFLSKARQTELKDINFKMLEGISVADVDAYIAGQRNTYTRTKKGVKAKEVSDVTLRRKLASIRSFYKFLNTYGYVEKNPAALVENIKPEEKNVVYLDTSEVGELITNLSEGDKLTKRERAFMDAQYNRDYAIIMLFLGTGLRISELAGIDTSSINFEKKSISVFRKGRKTSIVHYGDEVQEALLSYYQERKAIVTDTDAFFLSRNNTRLCTRQIERMVKKYSRIFDDKKITPHKLRATFGTELYRNSNDIMSVSKMLNHSSPEVTARAYVHVDKEKLYDRMLDQVQYFVKANAEKKDSLS